MSDVNNPTGSNIDLSIKFPPIPTLICSEHGNLVFNCVIFSPNIFLNLIISFREVKEERPYFIKRLPILCVLRRFQYVIIQIFHL